MSHHAPHPGAVPNAIDGKVRVTLARALARLPPGSAVSDGTLRARLREAGLQAPDIDHALSALANRNEIYKTVEGWRFVPAGNVRAPRAEMILQRDS